MIIKEDNKNYAQLEELLEKRLKSYISFEQEKLKVKNVYSGSYVIYPKNSYCLTNLSEIAGIYFEVMNNLEYHYYKSGSVMLRGFINSPNSTIPTTKFILRSTIEELKADFFLLLDEKKFEHDEIYIHYIIRLPVIKDNLFRTISRFINAEFNLLKTKSKYYESKQESILNKNAQYKIDNEDSIKKQKRKYYQRNQQKIINTMQLYKSINKEKYRQYEKERYLINKLFKQINKKNDYDSSIEILDCSRKEFKQYIEAQFVDNMSWLNSKEWKLDYKTPIPENCSQYDLAKLNHYTNLIPVWIDENKYLK